MIAQEHGMLTAAKLKAVCLNPLAQDPETLIQNSGGEACEAEGLPNCFHPGMVLCKASSLFSLTANIMTDCYQ